MGWEKKKRKYEEISFWRQFEKWCPAQHTGWSRAVMHQNTARKNTRNRTTSISGLKCKDRLYIDVKTQRSLCYCPQRWYRHTTTKFIQEPRSPRFAALLFVVIGGPLQHAWYNAAADQPENGSMYVCPTVRVYALFVVQVFLGVRTLGAAGLSNGGA